jgi:hypothetical protein
MSETAIIPLPPPPPPKPPRRVKREKYVKTITLFEKNLDSPTGRRETRIPATIDAAKVLAIMTAEKMRSRIEIWLNDIEDGKHRPTPKEYKDMMEALKGCDDIIKGAMEAPSSSKPGAQSLILNNSVISTGGAGGAPASDLMSIVSNAAKAANTPKIVTETKE